MIASDTSAASVELNHPSLSQVFFQLHQNAPKEGVLVSELFESMRLRGHAFLLILMGLPFVLPIPLLGLAAFFGLGIIFVGLRMACGQQPWLPEFIMKQRVPLGFLEALVKHGNPFLQKIERVLHPRLYFLTEHRLAMVANGLMIAVMGFLLTWPIPFTNAICAIPIVLIGLGIMERDGGFVAVGHLIGVFTCGIFTTLLVLGHQSFEKIWQHWVA